MLTCQICDLIVINGNSIEGKLNTTKKLTYQTTQY